MIGAAIGFVALLLFGAGLIYALTGKGRPARILALVAVGLGGAAAAVAIVGHYTGQHGSSTTPGSATAGAPPDLNVTPPVLTQFTGP